MSNFSYVCKHCHASLQEGEQVHLFHVRHGKVLGEVEGRCNGYGGVCEDEIFDHKGGVAQNNPNNHEEIIKSCFGMKDSAQKSVEHCKKVYHGDIVDIFSYVDEKCWNSPTSYAYTPYWPYPSLDDDIRNQFTPEFLALSDADGYGSASGIVAYHSKCHDIAKKDGSFNLIPSEKEDTVQH